jgi:hypothetical protein
MTQTVDAAGDARRAVLTVLSQRGGAANSSSAQAVGAVHDRIPQGLQSLPSYMLWQNSAGLAIAAPSTPIGAHPLPGIGPGSNASGWHQAGAVPALQRAQLLRPSDLPPAQDLSTAHAAGRLAADRLILQPLVKAAPPLQSNGAAHGNAMPLLPQCSDVYHLAGEHRFFTVRIWWAMRCVQGATESGLWDVMAG